MSKRLHSDPVREALISSSDEFNRGRITDTNVAGVHTDRQCKPLYVASSISRQC